MADRIKGITIEIGGDTTKLSDSLKKVNSSLKNTETQLKDVNKLLKLDPNNTELLRQKHELLGKAVTDTKEKLKEEKAALEALQNAPNASETVDQQNALKREIIETTASLKDYQKELSQSNVTLTKMKNISSDVAAKTKRLSAVAAGFGAALLGNAYNAARTADDLNTLSKQYNISTEQIQKFNYAQDLVDVSTEDMLSSMNKLTKQMGKGSEVFDELGVSITDASGNYRAVEDVWYDTLEALSKIEDETQRDIMAQELFGKSAVSLTGIIDDGGAALREMGDQAEEMGLILSQDALDSANQFNDSIDRLKATASQAFLEAGASLAETLVPALESLVENVSAVLKWFGDLDGSTQTLILTFAGMVAVISPLASVVAGLSTALMFMLTPIGLVVTALAGIVAIGVIVYKNWDMLKEWAGEIAQSIAAKFQFLANAIKDKMNAAKDAVHNAIEKIKSFFKFEWSLPHLKMPHFHIEGEFSLSPPSVPHIGVDWYKKAYQNPVLFTQPTVLQTAGGLKGFGDGAGAEVVMGLNKLKEMVGGDNININVYGAQGQDVRALAAEVERALVRAQKSRSAVFA